MTRHTADTITDPVLDDLYARLVQIRQLAGDAIIGLHTSPAAPAAGTEAQELADARRCYEKAAERADLAAAERDALSDDLVLATAVSDRHRDQAARYRLAWQSARRRASALTAELTRRAPLNGKYAHAVNAYRAYAQQVSRAAGRTVDAEQAEAALDRVHALADRWERYGTPDLARYANILRETLDGTEAAPAPAATEPVPVACSTATLDAFQGRNHRAHDWEPQPGMRPVRCPGHRGLTATEATEATAFRRRCAGLARNADDFADAYREVVTDRAAIRDSDEPEQQRTPLGDTDCPDECPCRYVCLKQAPETQEQQ